MDHLTETHGIRELLQYVPQFSGKLFAFDVQWNALSDSLKSEVMLDLSGLQGIGVKMILCVERESLSDVENWAIDFELKLAKGNYQTAGEIEPVLDRGQAAMMARQVEQVLGPSFTKVAKSLKPEKVISLLKAEFPHGASMSLAEWKQSEYVTENYFSSVCSIIESDTKRIHLLDVSQPGVILSELFSSEGCGLMIHQDSYRLIRPIQRDDIPELLTMIGRSVRKSKLVPRVYEDIERQLEDYYVYELDGTVVGCVALHHYSEQWAEVACLYVKKGHKSRGYGEEMVKYAEKLAGKSSVEAIFALTTGASDFFTERLKYSEINKTQIPVSRLEMLEQSGRDSRVFCKKIN